MCVTRRDARNARDGRCNRPPPPPQPPHTARAIERASAAAAAVHALRTVQKTYVGHFFRLSYMAPLSQQFYIRILLNGPQDARPGNRFAYAESPAKQRHNRELPDTAHNPNELGRIRILLPVVWLAAAEPKAKPKVPDESQPRKIPQQKSNALSRETGGKKTKARRDPVLPSFPTRTRTHMRTQRTQLTSNNQRARPRRTTKTKRSTHPRDRDRPVSPRDKI